MLDKKGFDLWADGYDKAVELSDEEKSYPFAGYKEVLGRIYRRVMAKKNPRILDIGFGTGTLTARLYEQGCEVWGQDFSERMIELAKAKMPGAPYSSVTWPSGPGRSWIAAASGRGTVGTAMRYTLCLRRCGRSSRGWSLRSARTVPGCCL